MLGSALLLLFSLLMGLAGLAVGAWIALSSRVTTLDGIVLLMISLLLGGLFLLDFVLSVRTGGLRELINHSKSAPARPGSPTKGLRS